MTDMHGRSLLPFGNRHVSSAIFPITSLVLWFEVEPRRDSKDGVRRHICRDVLADLLRYAEKPASRQNDEAILPHRRPHRTPRNQHECHKARRERCPIVSQTFQTTGTEALGETLGERYEECVNLTTVELGSVVDDGSEPPTVPPRSALRPPWSMSARHPAKAKHAPQRTPMAVLSRSISR